jgi:hypothetical protein
MRTPIEWAELHAPLFLAGTNLQQKLDPKKRTGLVMEYDEDKRHLYVMYNECVARVPETSVLSMVELKLKVAPRAVANAEPFRGEAQVSTPQSHVFAGMGHGQTGQEEPVKRGPGRPPKAP